MIKEWTNNKKFKTVIKPIKKDRLHKLSLAKIKILKMVKIS
jgi:hypothetical protein